MGYTPDVRLAAGPEESWLLGTAFTPGARLGTRLDDPTIAVHVVEVAEVTMLRIPSGRVIVDSPWPDEGDLQLRTPVGRELLERVPPGSYQVEAAWTESPYEFMGEYFDGREVGAVRLRIVDDPVAVWEMALGVDDDIAALSSGDRIGFNSEANSACFADASAWQELAAPFRQFWKGLQSGDEQPLATESLCDESFERTSDEALAADLMTFPSEGETVVWLGRTESGTIASIVTVVAYGRHWSEERRLATGRS
ncbi:hypothetical protein GCM10009665_42150 [Kitasatospora nipponensis]|uniref:DUF4241 domain-containing protein n=1 Tax=Kitasatospora nipponensis TaxID=258049 RepID=A0ABN1WDK5_9ACTN